MLQSIKSRLKCTGCIESLVGGRSENQDSAASADTPLGTLVVVCDGMGGMKGGKKASSMAVDSVIASVSAAPEDGNPAEVLYDAIAKANSSIAEEGRKEEFKGMGTTVVALLLTERSAVVAQLGDSRVYQIRKGKKIFRTTDHSMVFDMVKANVITEEQARLSSCSNIILKALGISETAEPSIVELPYRRHDRFVLCTDGFWAATDEDTFLKKLSVKESPEQMLSALAEEIDSIGRDGGGNHDNLTAAIVDVDADSVLKDRRRTGFPILKLCVYVLLAASLGLNLYSLVLMSERKDLREELAGLRDDLVTAQEYLTAQKVEKILDMVTGGDRTASED